MNFLELERSEGQVFDFFVKRSITCPRDLLKVALTMLKQTKRKEGIASRRKFCGWDENFRDEVLGIKFID